MRETASTRRLWGTGPSLGFPDLWCLEHGAHVGRMLVEVRILVQWMNTQDPSIYGRYQAFGAGKAKLYSRILDEAPDHARSADFAAGLEEFALLSHNHDVIDHRVVDTADSFAGKSIREMATECGLLDLYRHNYYMASGVAHSGVRGFFGQNVAVAGAVGGRCLAVSDRRVELPVFG